jgi:hypothetical protein
LNTWIRALKLSLSFQEIRKYAERVGRSRNKSERSVVTEGYIPTKKEYENEDEEGGRERRGGGEKEQVIDVGL